MYSVLCVWSLFICIIRLNQTRLYPYEAVQKIRLRRDIRFEYNMIPYYFIFFLIAIILKIVVLCRMICKQYTYNP